MLPIIRTAAVELAKNEVWELINNQLKLPNGVCTMQQKWMLAIKGSMKHVPENFRSSDYLCYILRVGTYR